MRISPDAGRKRFVRRGGPPRWRARGVSDTSRLPLFCFVVDLVWQTSHTFDLAESRKHAFVFLGNRVPFRNTAKLDHVSRGP